MADLNREDVSKHRHLIVPILPVNGLKVTISDDGEGLSKTFPLPLALKVKAHKSQKPLPIVTASLSRIVSPLR